MSGILDFVIVGSGFGGSVSALRLIEKGCRVRVLERGALPRRGLRDAPPGVARPAGRPAFRCFGILQISPSATSSCSTAPASAVESLGYANVLMAPDDELFRRPAWRRLADWKSLLLPHYDTARRMFGVTLNPRTWPADVLLKGVAGENLARPTPGRPTPVGTFFGQPENEGERGSRPLLRRRGAGPRRAASTAAAAWSVADITRKTRW